MQTDRARLTCTSAPHRFRRIERTALPRINRLTMFSEGALAILFEILRRAKTEIGFALGQQTLGMLTINFEAIGLPVRTVGAADIRPFVPIEAKPLQVIEQLTFKTRVAAVKIG